MAERAKQQGSEKDSQANKPTLGQERETAELGAQLAAVPQMPALNRLPDHPTARPLRQAAVLQMQRRHGNRAVQRMIQPGRAVAAKTAGKRRPDTGVAIIRREEEAGEPPMWEDPQYAAEAGGYDESTSSEQAPYAPPEVDEPMGYDESTSSEQAPYAPPEVDSDY